MMLIMVFLLQTNILQITGSKQKIASKFVLCLKKQ
jgi:hypothetical protein